MESRLTYIAEEEKGKLDSDKRSPCSFAFNFCPLQFVFCLLIFTLLLELEGLDDFCSSRIFDKHDAEVAVLDTAGRANFAAHAKRRALCACACALLNVCVLDLA
jgi:hypothetical protein